MELGVGRLITDDEALVQSALVFIKEGLDHLKKNRQSANQGEAFFEVSFYLGQFLLEAAREAESAVDQEVLFKQAQRFDQMALLNKWLENKKITNQDTAFLHLYRILFYSLYPKLSDQDIDNIYFSWSQYHLTNNGQQISPITFEHAEKFIIQLTSSLADRLRGTPPLPLKTPHLHSQKARSVYQRGPTKMGRRLTISCSTLHGHSR